MAQLSAPVPTSYIPPSVYESQSAGGIFSQNQASKEQDDESSEYESGSEVDTDSDDEEDERILVSDNESETNIKVVNIPITTASEPVDISEDFESESITEVNDLVESLPELVEDPIVVHKLEPTEETLVEEKDEAPASYAKLSTAELKKLVISKGLATEVGKMKKPQLVQLLELGVSE
jgi:hypothetical protein